MSIAAQWEFIPGLEVSESYDDNVRLEREGQEQHDYITQINPGFTLNGDGRYSDVSIDYQMQNIFYKENDPHDDTNHNLRATSHTELVTNGLYFDASANYSQRTINPEESSGIDNISITDNRTDFVAYALSPYVSHAFGSSSELLVRYTFNKIDFKENSLSTTDSETKTGYIELRSGPAFNWFTWQLSHDSQVTEYNERSDVESEDTELLFRYLFSNKSYFVGNIGYEKYNYNAILGQEDPEGAYWEAGLGWTPSHRTRLEYRKGEHYFGETESLEFDHRTRQTHWSVNYFEEITTTSRVEAQFDDRNNVPIYTNVPEVYLNKIFTASVTKNTGKTELSMTVVDSRRQFLESDGNERSSDITLRWNWQAGSRFRILLEKLYRRHRSSITERETEINNIDLRVERLVNNDITLYASHDNVKQENNFEGVLYRRKFYSIGVISYF